MAFLAAERKIVTVDAKPKAIKQAIYEDIGNKIDPPQDFQHNGDDTGMRVMTRHAKRDI